jgi:hypothetical protein
MIYSANILILLYKSDKKADLCNVVFLVRFIQFFVRAYVLKVNNIIYFKIFG